MTAAFSVYVTEHAARLQAAFDGPEWRAVAEAGLVEHYRAAMLIPSATANVFSLPVEQLCALNEARVRAMIESGERDEDRLLAALGTWPDVWPEEHPVRLSFLGLNVGYGCDMSPRCVYCNQEPTDHRMTREDLLRVVEDACAQEGPGPYIYITGGEPLLLGETLWGEAGLVRAATRAGGACNVNTNALGLTPEVALALVSAGLSRIHISLDSHDPSVQDAIHQRPGRWAQVTAGIHNLQIAKAALGADHPVIHLNCVLTRLNAEGFPLFLRFALGMKPLPHTATGPGATHRDMDMHVIPVGGRMNDELRLTREGYARFFTSTWEAADAEYQAYLAVHDVAPEKRSPLHEAVPFMSPFHRVGQKGDLEAWAERAAQGRPADLALCRQCYVVPTQGFVLPDGSQYWCGGHTVSRPAPAGSVLSGATIRSNIHSSMGHLSGFPGPACANCAGATLAINQAVEASLRERVRGLLAEP